MDDVLRSLIVYMGLGIGSSCRSTAPVWLAQAAQAVSDYAADHGNAETAAVADVMTSLTSNWELLTATERKALFMRGVEYFGGLLATRMSERRLRGLYESFMSD